MASVGGKGVLPLLIFVTGLLSDSCTYGRTCTACTFAGPTLNCVGFTTCSVDGECKCYFNGNLQYGVCMELTVEVGNASTDLNCQWYVRMNGMYVEQDKTDPNDFFVVKGNKSQILSFRREFSSFYSEADITFNCTDNGSRSSLVYSLNEFTDLPECKEYFYQQTPYIVSPRRQVNVSAVVGKPLTLGPIVVKNLNVGNVISNGTWCHRSGGEVNKCCDFEVTRYRRVDVIPAEKSCGGAMKEWSLLRLPDCETGMVDYSLFKSNARASDTGDYVFSINNMFYSDSFTTAVEVPVSPQDSLPAEYQVTIAVVVTFVVCFAVVVSVCVLVWCVFVVRKRRAERRRVQLLHEDEAQDGEPPEPEVAANPDVDDEQRRRHTNESVILDLGGSTLSRVV